MKTETKIFLTEKEIEVLNVYVNDCFVADYGWDDESASMWTQDIGSDVSFGKSGVSGVIASLVSKEIVWSNGSTGRDATMSLTPYGMNVVSNCDEIVTPY